LEVKSSPLQRSSKVGPQLCHKNHGPLFDCITRMCVCVCVCVRTEAAWRRTYSQWRHVVVRSSHLSTQWCCDYFSEPCNNYTT